MQLMHLGEQFDRAQCNGKCDNCKLGLTVGERDYTTESVQVLKMVQQLTIHRQNYTLKMAVEVFKGRPIKSKYNINQSIVDQFSGKLKLMSDVDLHRLIIKLLTCHILEEQFISTKI